ncbi:hypothetical protein [Aeoliella sp.]|uniref:hypothetical protein n=1 Tax=Aeoliella sp. TaxID=2795800 RepID=UPI003CCBD85B
MEQEEYEIEIDHVEEQEPTITLVIVGSNQHLIESIMQKANEQSLKPEIQVVTPDFKFDIQTDYVCWIDENYNFGDHRVLEQALEQFRMWASPVGFEGVLLRPDQHYRDCKRVRKQTRRVDMLTSKFWFDLAREDTDPTIIFSFFDAYVVPLNIEKQWGNWSEDSEQIENDRRENFEK